MVIRKQIDWEAIDKEIVANQLSLREIGRQFDVSEGAIRKHIKAKRIKRNLAERVREKVREKLVRSEVRNPNASDEEIVEEKGEVGATVITLHRKDIAKSQTLVQLFQSQLQEAATSRDEIQETIIDETKGEEGKADQKRRNMMLKAVSLPSHAGVLRDLSIAQKNLIYLERQAFNLNDKEDPDPVEKIQLEFITSDNSGAIS